MRSETAPASNSNVETPGASPCAALPCGALPELAALTLAQARLALRQHATLNVLPLRVVETAPPLKPVKAARVSRGRGSHRSETAPGQSQQSEAAWGEWRVLRCRIVEVEAATGAEAAPDAHAAQFIELVVAREEKEKEAPLQSPAVATPPLTS